MFKIHMISTSALLVTLGFSLTSLQAHPSSGDNNALTSCPQAKKRHQDHSKQHSKRQRQSRNPADSLAPKIHQNLDCWKPDISVFPLTPKGNADRKKQRSQGDEGAWDEMIKRWSVHLLVLDDTLDLTHFLSLPHLGDKLFEKPGYMRMLFTFFKETYETHLPDLKGHILEKIAKIQSERPLSAFHVFVLGDLCAMGFIVPQDLKTLVPLYRFAADQGLALAQCELGNLYEQGYGVEQDYREAVRYYTLASHQGYVRAKTKLGLVHENGRGVSQDFGMAAGYYTIAADQGDAAAQNNLGLMYANSCGVNQNYMQAVRYFSMAAKQGNVKAQNTLGVIYHTGRGVRKDEAEALRYYNLAANQGHSRAQFSLGGMYANGEGVAKNEAMALKYFLLSFSKLDAENIQRIGDYLKSNWPLSKEQAIASHSFSPTGEELENNLRHLKSLDQVDAIFHAPHLASYEEGSAIHAFHKLHKDIFEHMNVLRKGFEILKKVGPGFMTTLRMSSDTLKNDLPHMTGEPFFSLDRWKRKSYFTVGEANCKLVKEFMEFWQDLQSSKKHQNILENLEKLHSAYTLSLLTENNDLLNRDRTPENLSASQKVLEDAYGFLETFITGTLPDRNKAFSDAYQLDKLN